MSKPKFNVAIVGGGIAGLVCAAAIQHFSEEKNDIKIDIYEAAPKFTEIGAGVGMYLRPWKAMKTLGFEEALCKLLSHVPREDENLDAFEMRKADQPTGVSFFHIKAAIGTLGFHRAHFLETIQNALSPSTCSFHFAKRLVSYTPRTSPNEPLRLNFQDGASAETDLLIACDGIHSVVRKQMLSNLAEMYEKAGEVLLSKQLLDVIEPVWSGSFCYRGIFPKDKLAAMDPNHRALTKPINYIGKDKHIIVFPIPGQHLINVVAFVSFPDKVGTRYEGKTVEDRPLSELLAEYEGWEEEVQQLLKCIINPSRWVINNLKGLPISISPLPSSPVALLGDAAHAMTPHQGSGAGQAIEDAYILGSLLTSPHTQRAHSDSQKDTIHLALSTYEMVRLPHANGVMERSRGNGRLYEFAEPRFAGLANVRFGESGVDAQGQTGKICTEADNSMLRGLGQAIHEAWRWAWETDIEDDRKRAMELLEERIKG